MKMLVAVIGEALAQIRWGWNRDGGCLLLAYHSCEGKQ
jgi:hypothetical protein